MWRKCVCNNMFKDYAILIWSQLWKPLFDNYLYILSFCMSHVPQVSASCGQGNSFWLAMIVNVVKQFFFVSVNHYLPP